MTVMGTMKNGVIIPDDASDIPEGARVVIRKGINDSEGFTMEDLKAIGHPILVEAYPGEFDDIYREMKELEKDELRAQEEQDRKRTFPE